MFRANSDEPFSGPHQKYEPVHAGADPADAKAAMILVHGRGASAESILMLARELNAEGFHFAAPQASRHTWYPYSFLVPTEQNEPGLSSGLQAIHNIISGLEENGLSREKIIILGFSQGACLASEFVARHPARYGGLAALSGGLIGESVDPGAYSGSLGGTPVYLGCSDNDAHIPEVRVDETASVLENLGASVTKKIYPGMGHTVTREELDHVQQLIGNL
jgi:phospholipase/carboxylesterase